MARNDRGRAKAGPHVPWRLGLSIHKGHGTDYSIAGIGWAAVKLAGPKPRRAVPGTGEVDFQDDAVAAILRTMAEQTAKIGKPPRFVTLTRYDSDASFAASRVVGEMTRAEHMLWLARIAGELRGRGIQVEFEVK